VGRLSARLVSRPWESFYFQRVDGEVAKSRQIKKSFQAYHGEAAAANSPRPNKFEYSLLDEPDSACCFRR
jgi:hypothetical protein